MEQNGKQRQKEASRRRIENGLLKLLEEKEFEAITITEIAAQADVARRTIYRLYKGKNEILQEYLAGLCEIYMQECRPLACYEIETIAMEFFSFWYRNRSLLLLLHKRKLDSMFYGVVCRTATEVIQKRMTAGGEIKADYFSAYSTGGFVHLLYRWIEEGMETKPEIYGEKVCEEILRFMIPVGGLS